MIRAPLVTPLLIALTIACLFQAGSRFDRKSAYARHVESGFVRTMTADPDRLPHPAL